MGEIRVGNFLSAQEFSVAVVLNALVAIARRTDYDGNRPMSVETTKAKRFGMLTYILLGLGAVIVLFIVVVAMRPNEFQVTRSAKIDAPASRIFAEVNDFHRWEAWSPWDKIDPKLERIYSGPQAGEGATYKWVGDKNVGEGVMTITESRPADHIRIRLEFIKPFAGVNDTLFTFQPSGNQTNVTWKMSGKYNFITKAMCLFMNMDKMIGDKFEEGLATMKQVAESN